MALQSALGFPVLSVKTLTFGEEEQVAIVTGSEFVYVAPVVEEPVEEEPVEEEPVEEEPIEEEPVEEEPVEEEPVEEEPLTEPEDTTSAVITPVTTIGRDETPE